MITYIVEETDFLAIVALIAFVSIVRLIGKWQQSNVKMCRKCGHQDLTTVGLELLCGHCSYITPPPRLVQTLDIFAEDSDDDDGDYISAGEVFLNPFERPLLSPEDLISSRSGKKRIKRLAQGEICFSCDSKNVSSEGEHVRCNECGETYEPTMFQS